MPGLFSSRRRGSSASRPVPPSTSSAAAAAAAGAYLHKSSSTTSLSSAAAAAALRSRPTSPEQVGSIQTKRMVRRGSVSSVGSGSVIGSGTRGAPGGRGGLTRMNSGGSMSERTFRSPSPGSNRQSPNGAVSPASDAPPVPALPPSIGSGHRRSTSLEAPQRITSPTPGQGKRGSSVDRHSVVPAPSTSRQAKRLSNVSEIDELDRQNSASRNFSRPMASPTLPANGTKKYTHGMGGYHTGPVGKAMTGSRPGTSDGTSKQQGFTDNVLPMHLSEANRSASYETKDSIMVYDPSTRTFISKPNPNAGKEVPPSPTLPQAPALAPGTYDPSTRSIVPGKPAKATPSSASLLNKKTRPQLQPVETGPLPPPRHPARISLSPSPTSPRAQGVLPKQPSVVPEDPEGEETAESQNPASSLNDTGRITQTSAGPAKVYVAPLTHQRSGSLDVPRRTVEAGRGRNISMSPSRSAHFSASPIVYGQRHNPPPRDLSPVKSAMKHSPASSVRTSSPMATFSPISAPAIPPSDASDTTSLYSQDGLLPKKKKSVRVSFDDQPEIVEISGAAAAAPKAIAAQASERSPAIDDEMEELMKPRPALPSFGSVRRSSGRRPPEMPEKVTEMAPERDGVSSDAALGGVLNTHKVLKISVDEKDIQDGKIPSPPIPPQVTSKDIPSEASDVDEDESGFKPEVTSTPARAKIDATLEFGKLDPDVETRDFAAETSNMLGSDDGKTNTVSHDSNGVPGISLLPPTPGDEPEKELGDHAVQGNGNIKPESSAGDGEAGSIDSIPARQLASTMTPANTTTEEFVDAQPHTAVPVYANEHLQPSPNLEAIDEDDSDDSAAFSDAAEDLSDLDEGGFASLNAIVSSPVVPSPATTQETATASTLPESPTSKPAAIRQARQAVNDSGSGDWSQATAYWSNLTKQQRQQIEREHLSSDDERPVPAPKPKKKKSALKQTAPSAPAPSAAENAASKQMPKTLRAQPGPAAVPTSGTGDSDVRMRRTMRPQSSDGGAVRSSLRSSGSSDQGRSNPMRTTMRSGPPSQQRPQSAMSSTSSGVNKTSARPTSAVGGLSSSSAGAAMTRARAGTTDSDDVIVAQDSAFPRVQSKRASQVSQQQKGFAAAVPPPGAYTQKLQQKVTANNDSDSESSFKKKRKPAATAGDGRYTMRRSMRAGSVGRHSEDSRPTRPMSPESGAKRGGGAFSIRSLSPTGASWGRDRGEKLRSSLRSPSVDTGARMTTLRSGNAVRGGSKTRVSSRPASSAGGASKFKSRFRADSDDDDDERPAGRSFFKSRYADSDDSDDGPPGFIAADLTPVRGIPRRKGQDDGDSTDLEDEDDEAADPRKASRKREKQIKPGVPDPAEVDKAMEAARRKLGIAAPGAEGNQGSALNKGSLRGSPADVAKPVYKVEDLKLDTTASPPQKKKGFMGSILRRNRNSTQSVMTINQQNSPTMSGSPKVTSAPAAATSSSVANAGETSAPSSPSQAKLVRRASHQPSQTRMKRGDSNVTAPPSSGDYGRATEDRENWPLPPPIPDDPSRASLHRPTTSDGVNPEAIRLARSMRPDLAPRAQSGIFEGREKSRRSVRMADGVKEDDGGNELTGSGFRGVYSERTGRKKKFGMLRRAFGLND
ncbi:hypothetical protein Tdes44962_MAKER00519 [Teratosphaeria destructans]|uniref:Uncharacterized protein n=1 Tax=Teratosphaeria destructans TaxID=418781 RepID=A0A9W7W1N6_9PEZI|nr:hypothetical protein Tdes44962_MAKER00519 [Teratosphaeria destructans]